MYQLKISNNTITRIDSDSLSIYLKEIDKVPLLSIEEEVLLAKKIKQGDQKALEKLIEANLRFVVSVAKQYYNTGIPLNDLINEGNKGLIKAAKKFDETKGFKFISYAVWWIRQSIHYSINNDVRIVRMPLNKVGYKNKIKEASHLFEQDNERIPTNEELSEITGLSVEEIQSVISGYKGIISVDAPLDKQSDSLATMLDILCDTDQKIGKEQEHDESLSIELTDMLSGFTDRERQIIEMFFGIGKRDPLSLSEIAGCFDLTRERVRQIKDNVLNRLRSQKNKDILQEYLE